MQSTYLPQRSDIVFNQFKDADLYPNIDAPIFSPFGGDYTHPVILGMEAGSNAIYYTLDNSDPREIGGAVAMNRAFLYIDSIALTQDVIIKARAKNGNTWSALTRAKFNIVSDPRIPILISPVNGAPVDSDKGITCIWSKPASDDLTNSLYVYGDADTNTFSGLTDTSFVVPANTFAQSMTYLWKVVASNGADEAESMAYIFNTNNIAPGAFGIISHANGDILDATTDVIYSWSKSKDEDILSYELSINDGKSILAFTTTDTMYLVPGNTLQRGKAYSIHVVENDGKATATTPKVELNTLTGLLEMETIAYTKIYPNPTRNNINIELQVERPLTIRIELFDITERILQTKTLENLQGKHTEIIDMNEYNQGIYFAVIKSMGDNGLLIKTEKIIKH